MTAAVWSIVLPLLGGCAALVGGPGTARIAAGLSAVATSAAVVALGFEVVNAGPVRYAVGGWGAPLGIELAADGLTIAMLLATAAIVNCVAAYARGYYGGSGSSGRGRWKSSDAFWPLLLLLWGALDALFLAADLFNIYVTLELVTLAGVALVLLARESVARIAALRYLLAAMLGSLAFLFGVALLYAAFDTLDVAQLRERMTPGPPAWTAVALVTAGLAVKSALFPLHFWLPRAHASAPAPVSAVLSALVVTASWYLFVRLWFDVFPAVITPAAGQALGTLGALGILWGSLQAIRQASLKLMIAYSTVAQVGYLFLVVALTGRDAAVAADAWSGGVYLAVAHAFAKAAMFLAAGSIVQSLGRDQILGVRGIASHLPVTTYAFGIAGLTLIGLPPTGGFVAKWLLLTAAVSAGHWAWATVILLGGVLTAGYVFLVLGQELSQAEGEERPRFAPVPRIMEHSAMALALVGLVLGLRAVEPLALLRIGHPFAEAPAPGGGP